MEVGADSWADAGAAKCCMCVDGDPIVGRMLILYGNTTHCCTYDPALLHV
jgi:hypothetical protein